MNVISFDLVQKNPIFRFFGTFNRPKTPKPVPQKIATLFFGESTALDNILRRGYYATWFYRILFQTEKMRS